MSCDIKFDNYKAYPSFVILLTNGLVKLNVYYSDFFEFRTVLLSETTFYCTTISLEKRFSNSYLL